MGEISKMVEQMIKRIRDQHSLLISHVICSASFALVSLCLLLSAFPTQAQEDLPTILNNGTVKLGIEPETNLGAPGGTPSAGEGTTDIGLRLSSTGSDGISPGSS